MCLRTIWGCANTDIWALSLQFLKQYIKDAVLSFASLISSQVMGMLLGWGPLSEGWRSHVTRGMRILEWLHEQNPPADRGHMLLLYLQLYAESCGSFRLPLLVPGAQRRTSKYWSSRLGKIWCRHAASILELLELILETSQVDSGDGTLISLKALGPRLAVTNSVAHCGCLFFPSLE